MRVANFAVLAMLCGVYVSPTLAADYYVAPNGGTGKGTESDPWSLAHANSALRAGDTAILRGGTYRTTIQPANSGQSESQRITYRAYPGETPVIYGGTVLTGWTRVSGTDGVDAIYRVRGTWYDKLVEDDFKTTGWNTIYWNKAGTTKVVKDEVNQITHPAEYYYDSGWIYARGSKSDDLNKHHMVGIAKSMKGILIDGKSYITVRDITIQYVTGFMDVINSSHITLAGNTMRYSGAPSGWNGRHFVIRNNLFEGIGSMVSHNAGIWPYSLNDSLIENNEFAWGGHDNLLLKRGKRLVIRNNIFRNGAKLTAFRELYDSVIENNKIFYSAKASQLTRTHPKDHPGMYLAGLRNIIRNNLFWHNAGHIFLIERRADLLNSNGENVIDNHIYNNTFYDGIGDEHGAIYINQTDGPSLCANNTITNNIIYKHTYSAFMFGGGATASQQHITANLVDTDPHFVNNDTRNPDLHLRSDSPAIDAGRYLTKTTADGSGTVIPLNDVLYFSDGRGVTDGDVIQVGSEQVRITGMDRQANTVTVDRTIGWTKGTPVSLPYAGSRPDAGALEYGVSTASTLPPAPSGVSLTIH